MNRNDLPPPIERRKLTKVDFTLFAGVIFLVVYAVYQVNDVLVYKWNWGRVTNFVIRFDKDSGTYVANLLLHGLATTLRLAVWGTVLATIIGLVMGYWRTCENLTLRIISRCYVELIRNIPPVVSSLSFSFSSPAKYSQLWALTTSTQTARLSTTQFFGLCSVTLYFCQTSSLVWCAWQCSRALTSPKL